MALPRFRPPPPRRGTRPAVDLVRKAAMHASRLTEAEIRETMVPILLCLRLTCAGVAKEVHVDVLRTTMLLALEIERLGVVRGMAGHFEAAAIAIKSITNRASETGQWQPAVPPLYEIDAITCAVDLHDHQLRQLSAGELRRAVKRVIAQAQSQGGGQLLNVTNADLGMEVPA